MTLRITYGLLAMLAFSGCADRSTTSQEMVQSTAKEVIESGEGFVLRVSPEFDDVRLIAERDNKPIKDIHAIVMKAYLDRDRTKE